MKRKLIMIKDRANIVGRMIDNCYFNYNVIAINPVRNVNNSFLKALRKVHLSNKINKIIDLPFKYVWGVSFDNLVDDTNTEYYLIFANTAMFYINPSYLLKLKKKYNIHYILCFYDPVASDYSEYARKHLSILKFDYIFTFDPDDAVKYNYIYYHCLYSMLSENVCNEVDIDIYLIAAKKDRLVKLHKLYSYLMEHNAKTKFRIVNVPRKEQKYANEIIYNEGIEYPEVVEEVKKSNCILEVVSEGQSGATFRYYEAVCYNKKLLTTNKNVVNLPFYDPRYMRVFEKPEDIDVEWVKKREPIDYRYDGRFSPTHLIDKIIEFEEEKKKEGRGVAEE